jgi:queuine tRNA-ribosyltransferase
VKALSVEDVKNIGGQAVLANTYHLYLQPGSEIVKNHGGFAKMMNWTQESMTAEGQVEKRNLPTVTDSGGFQVFSLGAAFDTGVSKIATSAQLSAKQKQTTDDLGVVKIKSSKNQMAKIDEEGVTFKSFINGSYHS